MTLSDVRIMQRHKLGKMAERKDPELTSSHRHIKATTTCSATHSVNPLKMSIAALPQLKIERKSSMEKGRRGRAAAGNYDPRDGDPHKRRVPQVWRCSLRSKEIKPTGHSLPWSQDCPRKMSPIMIVFANQQSLTSGDLEDYRKPRVYS